MPTHHKPIGINIEIHVVLLTLLRYRQTPRAPHTECAKERGKPLKNGKDDKEQIILRGFGSGTANTV